MAHKPKKDQWARSFTVTEPTLHPNGYTVYRVTMLAFSANAPDETKEVCLWKRYSDFKTLHKVLSALHRNLHRPGAFPDFAEPVVFGRFNHDVIEVRRRSALAMLQFIATQSHLYNSPAFQQFLKVSESVPSAACQSGPGSLLSPCRSEAVETRQPQLAKPVVAALPPSTGNSPRSSSVLPPLSAGPLLPSLTQSTAIVPSMLPQQLTTEPSASVAVTASALSSSSSSSVDGSAAAAAASAAATVAATQFDSTSACYRTNRDLSIFDPLCGDTGSFVHEATDESMPYEDSSASADREAVEDLAAWADVGGISSVLKATPAESPALNLPEVLPSVEEPDFFADHLPEVPSERPSSSHPRGRSRRSLSPPPAAPPPDLEPEAAGSCIESSDYVTDASSQALQGERYFALGKHEVSLKHFECAVTLLIRGVQDDADEKRRALAAERTQQYLAQAQQVAKGFLHRQDSAGAGAPSLRLGAVSFDAMPLPTSRATTFGSCSGGAAESDLLGPVAELSNYKVLGVIDKVMLVLDKSTERTYVMKVLQKNEAVDLACERSSERHVIPFRCPNMVRIHRYYETESTIYLLLQHASGGRLWAYAAAHSHSPAGLQSARPRLASGGLGSGSGDNVYSGRRCSAVGVDQPGGRAEDDNDNSVASPERDDEECSQDYLDLLYNTSRRSTTADRSIETGMTGTENGSGHLGTQLPSSATAAGSQHPAFSLSRSTSDPFSAKHGSSGSAASHSLSSAVTGTPARRWSVTSDELGLPPPPTTTLHRPASSSRYRVGSISSVPESCVRQWAAEIAAALLHLHSVGVVCRDLRPDNVLLGEGGHVLLTFFGKWAGVRSVVHPDALKDLYAAPELQRPVTPGASISATCDWWSFGVLLYELLVGRTLRSAHPDGVGTHTVLTLPAHLTAEARDLLTQLIRHCPSERLGCGPAGEDDVTSHPFFRDIDWSVMCNISSHVVP